MKLIPTKNTNRKHIQNLLVQGKVLLQVALPCITVGCFLMAFPRPLIHAPL